MPINLDTFNAGNAQVKVYSPKFFSRALTGSGKKVGVLCEFLNPVHHARGLSMTTEHIMPAKRKMTSGNITTEIIPVNTLPYNAWKEMDRVIRPPQAHLTEIAKDSLYPDRKVYIDMLPHSIVLEETDNSASGGSKGRRTIPCYQIFLYQVNDPASEEHEVVGKVSDLKSGNTFAGYMSANHFTQAFTCDPMDDIGKIAKILAANNFLVDLQAIQDYGNDYSIYDAMCRRSEEWQFDIDVTLDMFFKNVAAAGLPANQAVWSKRGVVIETLHHIESHPVPLDIYRRIYDSLKTHFPADIAAALCKQNLNLLLSDTLNSLHANKALLSNVNVPNPKPPRNVNGYAYNPDQAKAIASQEPLVLVQSAAGTGKALPLDTPILTPVGWTTMGELHVGDAVIGSDGHPCRVVKIHEQGMKPGYRLTFRDGAQITACGEHQWTLFTDRYDGRPTTVTTLTTEEWVNNPTRLNHSYIPMVRPVEYAFGEKDLPLDPYFLGALIADGNLSTSTIGYTKSEMPVVEAVKAAAARSGFEMRETTTRTSTAKHWRFDHPTDVKCHHSELKSRLQALGLTVTSHDKFVPEDYKTASISQRKALLNGLFDGDGDIRTGRKYARFNTASERMANDVIQLLWSIGLTATKQRQAHPRGDYWSVNLLDQSWDPFVASEHTGKHEGSVRNVRRLLRSAEPVGPVPMRCIEVDAPDSLYVAKDFIVTHNSSTILGRIDWMVDNGVKPEDITVLSFTNAAADHITEKNPYVHSMTIAKMIHTIYSTNFTDHALSELDTVCNSLDIYFPTDDLAMEFKRLCWNVKTNEPNAVVNVNLFIEDHYDDVIRFLSTMHQTALELEIIICYQRIDQFVEPPEVQSRFLIIDEVQDNSIFEFIYALKYVDKHKESLFIVGKQRL